MCAALRVEGDNFSVEDGVGKVESVERVDDLGELPVLAEVVAAAQFDLPLAGPPAQIGDGPHPVPLDLEDPVLTVERPFYQGGEGRFEVPWKRVRAGCVEAEL